MTDKEKAIVMAYTGICMLTGDKYNIFHKYIEGILDKPVFTHELGLLADEIKKKSEADFMALCADEGSSENPYKWIPVSERLPKRNGYYLVTGRQGAVNKQLYQDGHWCGKWAILAWMPLPSPYELQESEDEN